MQREVLVLGGGPSGAAAALLLARAGRRVTLVERARFPRRKVCGEFIAADGIAALRALGLGEAFDAAAGPEIRRVALWAGERSLEAPMPAPYARALARETLDTLLLRHAEARGVEVVHAMKRCNEKGSEQFS